MSHHPCTTIVQTLTLTIVPDVQRDASSTKVIVPDIRHEVSNTNPIVSGVQGGVSNTRTIVSDIHHNNLKSREGVDGRNQAVSTTRFLLVTNHRLSLLLRLMPGQRSWLP